MTDGIFLDKLEALTRLPDEVFWREALMRGASSSKLSPGRMVDLGGRAHDCGRAFAMVYGASLESKGLDETCRESGIRVNEFGMPSSPELEVFALFEAPDQIFLRSDLLKSCDSYVENSGITDVLGDFSCGDVLLAHEWFHYLENKDSDSVFTLTHREQIGCFGKGRVLPQLSEIAAMAFTGEINGLQWSPFVLDCVFLSMNDMRSAMVLADRLLNSSTHIATI